MASSSLIHVEDLVVSINDLDNLFNSDEDDLAVMSSYLKIWIGSSAPVGGWELKCFCFSHSLVPDGQWMEVMKNLAPRSRSHQLWTLYHALVRITLSVCQIRMVYLYSWIYRVNSEPLKYLLSCHDLRFKSKSPCQVFPLKPIKMRSKQICFYEGFSQKYIELGYSLLCHLVVKRT